MPTAEITISNGHAPLSIGSIPRVVGALTSFAPHFARSAHDLPCDIAEIRLDLMSPDTDWLTWAKSIQGMGTPVILTVRLSKEGGKWKASDQDRLEIYEKALQNLGAVDVELHSEIAEIISQKARSLGKVCILSHHDFDKTPPLSNLQSVIRNGQKIGSIVKISTMIHTAQDVETLHALLKEQWEVPICVIGMGPQGTQTRVSFPVNGSCLTYGYLLNEPSAPGQLSASELTARLRASLPAFDQEYLRRRRPLLQPRQAIEN